MLLLHSLKPGTLGKVISSGYLQPRFSSFSNCSGVWFSCLPEFKKMGEGGEEMLGKEYFLFHNTGPVLVFPPAIEKLCRMKIESFSPKNTLDRRLHTKLNTGLQERIYKFYNHPSHKFNTIHTSRWAISHEVYSIDRVPLTSLKKILVYTPKQLEEIPPILEPMVKKQYNIFDISFRELYLNLSD